MKQAMSSWVASRVQQNRLGSWLLPQLEILGLLSTFCLYLATTGLGATLVNSTLESISSDNNQTGIQGELSISEDFDFGVTISKFSLNLCAS
jgi:hypothetical protein